MQSSESTVLYIDWAAETHTLSEQSSIDVTDATPMIEERLPDIDLRLYPQQRIITRAFLDVEKTQFVNTYLPPITLHKNLIQKPVVGRFYSNLWRINMPVGSGKTAIVFAIVSKRPIPDHREVITGQDGAHTSLLYSPSVYPTLPVYDVHRVAQSMDWPCYFQCESKRFPMHSARAVGKRKVKAIFPLNLYFVARHLYGQLVGYLQTQVRFKYQVFTNAGSGSGIVSIFDFIFDLLCQKSYVNSVKLVLIPLIKYNLANYAYALNKIDNILNKPRNVNRVHPLIVTRLRKMRNMLENSNDPSSYDLFQLASFAYQETKYYARVFYDDYDSLVSINSGKMCALTHVFISSSNIHCRDSDLSPSRRLLGAAFARIMSNIDISESKVKNLLKLKEPKTKEYECTEDFQKILTKRCLRGIEYIARAYATISISLSRKLPFHSDELFNICQQELDPIRAAIREMISAFNGDGRDSFVKHAIELNQLLRKIGLQMAEIDAEDINVRRICDAIYRTYNNHRIVLNLTRIATQLLYDMLNSPEDLPKPEEVAATSTIWRNFLEKFSFPERECSFEEAVQANDDYAVLLYNLSRAKNPTDSENLISVMEGNRDAAGLFAPHALEHTRSKQFVRTLSMLQITDHLQDFSIVYATLDSDLGGLEKVSGRCSHCTKTFINNFYITKCCGIAICSNCLDDIFALDAQGTIRCRACLEQADDAALTFFTDEFAENARELHDICIAFESKKGRSPYIQPLTQYLSITQRTGSAKAKGQFNRTTNNKKQTLVRIVLELRKALRAEPKVLLYARHGSEWGEVIIEFARRHRLTAEFFTARHKADYERGLVNIIIIDAVNKITGFNMQYLDAIIFYSPERNQGVYKQIVGRAQRIQRDQNKRLYIYSLAYPSERETFDKKETLPDMLTRN